MPAIVVENRSWFIVPVAFEVTRINDIHERLRNGRADGFDDVLTRHAAIRDGKRTIWKQLEPREAASSVSRDLYAHVGHILHGKASKPFSGAPPYEIPKAILGQCLFALEATKAATKRLKNDARWAVGSTPLDPEQKASIILQLTHVRLYLLGSGTAILCCEIEYLDELSHSAALTPDVILEGNHALCHALHRAPKLRLVERKACGLGDRLKSGDRVRFDGQNAFAANADDTPTTLLISSDVAKNAGAVLKEVPDAPTISWSELMQQLLQSAGVLEPAASPTEARSDVRLDSKQERTELLEPRAPTRSRTFTYSCVRVSQDTTEAEARDLAVRLAHKNTRDYVLPARKALDDVYDPFANVLHCVTTEGASAVVREAATLGSAFTQQFLRDSFRHVYLPLALVAIHEYVTLLRLGEDAAVFPDFRTPSKTHLQQLEEVQNGLITFRLFYRFSEISTLNHQNVLHRRWREVLSVNRILDEVSRDAAEAEKLLDRARQKRWRVWGSLGAALLSAHFAFEIYEVIHNVWLFSPLDWQLSLFNVKDAAGLANLAAKVVKAEHHAEVASVIAVLIGVLVGWAAYCRGPNTGGGHH